MSYARCAVMVTCCWWSRPQNCFLGSSLVELPSMLAGARRPECPDDIRVDRMYPPDQLQAIATRCVEYVGSFSHQGVPEGTTHVLISWPDFLAEVSPSGTVGRCSLDVTWHHGIERLSCRDLFRKTP